MVNKVKTLLTTSFCMYLLVFFSIPTPAVAQVGEECTEATLRALGVIVLNCNPEINCELPAAFVATSGSNVGKIYVLGDSVTLAARAEIQERLNVGAWEVFVDAANNRALTESTIDTIKNDAARRIQLEESESIIVQLGSQNASALTSELIQQTVNDIRLINPSIRIYWVDVGAHADGTGKNGNASGVGSPSTPAVYAGSNTALYNEVSGTTSSAYSIVPWFSAVYGQDSEPTAISSELVDTKNYLQNNELLPSETGATALATTIAGAVTFNNPEGVVPTGSQTTVLWPDDLDERWIDIWTDAAEIHGIDRKLLAGIFTAEHGGKFFPITGDGGTAAQGGWRQPPSSSATGPFQILDGTWDDIRARLDTSLPPRTDRGPSDPRNDPALASQAAAAYVKLLGGVPGLPSGSRDQPQGFKPNRGEIPFTAASVGIRYNQGPAWHDNYGTQGVNRPYEYAQDVVDTYIELGGENATGVANCKNTTGVPGGITRLDDIVYYSQRDPRWTGYGVGTVKACGCGPTSMAMIVATLTDDPRVTPQTMSDFAAANNHQAPGCGSSWSLWPAAADTYGLDSVALGIDYDAAAQALREGSLVVASMSEGDFTTGGHIIVIRAVTEDGKFLVADPNDGDPGNDRYQQKSLTEWDASILEGQTKGLWSISKTRGA